MIIAAKKGDHDKLLRLTRTNSIIFKEEHIDAPLKEKAWMNVTQAEIDAFNMVLEEEVFGPIRKPQTATTDLEKEAVDTSFNFGANNTETQAAAEEEEKKEDTTTTKQQKSWLNLIVTCAVNAANRALDNVIRKTL